jgi:4-oxalocrotonate tautomerase
VIVPFINVKVASESLDQHQIHEIQKGISSLMVSVLHKVGPLISVLVEQVPLTAWSIGGESVTRAAQIDAMVSSGTNTPEEKANFIAEANKLLKSILGTDLSEVSYIIVHDVPKDSWGYGGLTQEHRAKLQQGS